MFTPEASVTSRVRVTVCDEEETSTVDGETERFENTGGSVSATEFITVSPVLLAPPAEGNDCQADQDRYEKGKV